MARIDKVRQIVRAPAGTALTGILGVKMNSGGSVVPSGSADALGIVVLPGTIAAGDPVGVLIRGEVVEVGYGAGSLVYAGPAGSVSTTSTSGTLVGFTVEATRLVVTM